MSSTILGRRATLLGKEIKKEAKRKERIRERALVKRWTMSELPNHHISVHHDNSDSGESSSEEEHEEASDVESSDEETGKTDPDMARSSPATLHTRRTAGMRMTLLTTERLF